MDSYLKKITGTSKMNFSNDNKDLNILQGRNCNDEPYFYLEYNCCNLNNKSQIKVTGEMLTELEWDCNEIYINNSEDIICLLQTALYKVKLIKDTLKALNSTYSFDICLSIDDKECDVLPSATVRFYAIRNNDPYISHDILNLEEFTQPILIEYIK